MELNLATTVSSAAAATTASLSVLGAYLSRRPESRHFRYAALAGLAGAIYSITNVILAANVGDALTLAAGRVSVAAACVHATAWIAFLAAWEPRRLSRLERILVVTTLIGGLVALVPGAVVPGAVADRVSTVIPIHYRDTDFNLVGVLLLFVCYAGQLVAAHAAVRLSHRNPRARFVGIALSFYCIVIPLDLLTGVHILNFPYLVDPVIGLVCLSIGAVVVADAGESAAKSMELERARVALAERENLAALGQLAAVVAHEVRNPVAIIFGALTALQRAQRSEEDARLLGIVGEEAERLKQLVSRLLDAVRPFELQYSRRSAILVVRSAIVHVTTGVGVADDEVSLEGAPIEEVECDEILLGQAIANLVQNALCATGRRSPVRVRATVETTSLPAMLRVQVDDDGEGVPTDVRSRLFTPFFTTRATGTGLGLALVRRIASAHGGTVDYAPQLERGASFVLRIPLRAGGAKARRLIESDLG